MGCSLSKKQKEGEDNIVFPAMEFLMHKDLTEWERNDYNKRRMDRLFKFIG